MRARRDAAARRRANRLGHVAETLALLLLMLKGYRPLARRFAASGGEIDLVMRRGRTVAFVEVKARADLEGALAAIDARKRERFCRAARAFAARHPSLAELTLRADAVLLAPGRLPRHLPDLFEITGF